MNTPTHVLVSAAVLAKPGAEHVHRNWAVLVGAVIADLSIFVMYFWTRVLMGQPEDLIWREIYFTPFWQSIGMIANSFPLYASAALVAWWRGWQIMLVFALSALLHVSFDFPVHNDDAHAHFWPFTTWRFESPLSYWDPDHFGLWVAGVEVVFGVVLVAVLWNRFPTPLPRTAMSIGLLAYIAVPAYFLMQLGVW